MKLKANGGWWQFTEPLRNLEPFTTHGALFGERGPAYGLSIGRLPSEYHNSVKRADYVVYSYATPIAWHVPNRNIGFTLGDGTPAPIEPGWVTPQEKYSVTTSKHQGRIFTAISQIREPVVEYRVWCENGDLVEVFTDPLAADAEVETLNQLCPCGEESCGVISEHGYFVQEVEN